MGDLVFLQKGEEGMKRGMLDRIWRRIKTRTSFLMGDHWKNFFHRLSKEVSHH